PLRSARLSTLPPVYRRLWTQPWGKVTREPFVNQIESTTGKSWSVASYLEVLNEISKRQQNSWPHFPHYEYLVYLRHHGFPSPFLDWSTSPYVTAYFAFEPQSNAERCAVYLFVKAPDGFEGTRVGLPAIYVQGPFVSTHSRHFAQKSWYTTATQWLEDRHVFVDHEQVYSDRQGEQDVLVKLTLPRSERIRALSQLEDLNINHYTLFQSEDSLIRTMSIRAFELEMADLPKPSDGEEAPPEGGG
ncbi:MAG: FRG domain-containing protein, partial [Planctomycetota bacterium]